MIVERVSPIFMCWKLKLTASEWGSWWAHLATTICKLHQAKRPKTCTSRVILELTRVYLFRAALHEVPELCFPGPRNISVVVGAYSARRWQAPWVYWLTSSLWSKHFAKLPIWICHLSYSWEVSWLCDHTISWDHALSAMISWCATQPFS